MLVIFVAEVNRFCLCFGYDMVKQLYYLDYMERNYRSFLMLQPSYFMIVDCYDWQKKRLTYSVYSHDQLLPWIWIWSENLSKETSP
jgi:hypothetical protein